MSTIFLKATFVTNPGVLSYLRSDYLDLLISKDSQIKEYLSQGSLDTTFWKFRVFKEVSINFPWDLTPLHYSFKTQYINLREEKDLNIGYFLLDLGKETARYLPAPKDPENDLPRIISLLARKGIPEVLEVFLARAKVLGDFHRTTISILNLKKVSLVNLKYLFKLIRNLNPNETILFWDPLALQILKLSPQEINYFLEEASEDPVKDLFVSALYQGTLHLDYENVPSLLKFLTNKTDPTKYIPRLTDILGSLRIPPELKLPIFNHLIGVYKEVYKPLSLGKDYFSSYSRRKLEILSKNGLIESFDYETYFKETYDLENVENILEYYLETHSLQETQDLLARTDLFLRIHHRLYYDSIKSFIKKFANLATPEIKSRLVDAYLHRKMENDPQILELWNKYFIFSRDDQDLLRKIDRAIRWRETRV